jgi:putative component of membrane protein insertase Oxa1/YidC/SpoIIIJ protein YidD
MYWSIIPSYRRRQCIFKTSCSHYVFEQTLELGFKAGLKALQYRYRNCRGGYICYLNPITGRPEMELVSGEVIFEEHIAKWCTKELKN